MNYILPASLVATAYLAVRSVMATHGLNLVGGPLNSQENTLLAGVATTALASWGLPKLIGKFIAAIRTPAAAAPGVTPGGAIPGIGGVGPLISQFLPQGQIAGYIEQSLGLSGTGLSVQIEKVIQAVVAYGRPAGINCVFSWGPGRDFPITYGQLAAPVPQPQPMPQPTINPQPPIAPPLTPMPQPNIIAPLQPIPGPAIPLQ